MTIRLLLIAAAALAFAGCTTAPKPPLSSAPVTSASPAPAGTSPPQPTVSLEAEQRRLAELFRGTPVVFQMLADGSLRVEVPLKYSFDKGRAAVKPPLAAVLDRIVPSMKNPGTRARVMAPPDVLTAGASSSLARDRAASARDYLVGKGVPPTHFGLLSAAASDTLEIVIAR